MARTTIRDGPPMRSPDPEYHVERARMELDAAYRATRAEAAAAHLRLCSLHMERARALPPEERGTRTELEWIERCGPLHGACLTA